MTDQQLWTALLPRRGSLYSSLEHAIYRQRWSAARAMLRIGGKLPLDRVCAVMDFVVRQDRQPLFAELLLHVEDHLGSHYLHSILHNAINHHATQCADHLIEHYFEAATDTSEFPRCSASDRAVIILRNTVWSGLAAKAPRLFAKLLQKTFDLYGQEQAWSDYYSSLRLLNLRQYLGRDQFKVACRALDKHPAKKLLQFWWRQSGAQLSH